MARLEELTAGCPGPGSFRQSRRSLKARARASVTSAPSATHGHDIEVVVAGRPRRSGLAIIRSVWRRTILHPPAKRRARR